MAEITSHPLFGYTAVDNVVTGAYTLTGKGANGAETIADIQGYAFRESGIEKKIKENIQIGVALSSPENYMRDKNADLVKIGNALAGHFRTEYERLLQAGSSDVEAKKEGNSMDGTVKSKIYGNSPRRFPNKNC